MIVSLSCDGCVFFSVFFVFVVSLACFWGCFWSFLGFYLVFLQGFVSKCFGNCSGDFSGMFRGGWYAMLVFFGFLLGYSYLTMAFGVFKDLAGWRRGAGSSMSARSSSVSERNAALLHYSLYRWLVGAVTQPVEVAADGFVLFLYDILLNAQLHRAVLLRRGSGLRAQLHGAVLLACSSAL